MGRFDEFGNWVEDEIKPATAADWDKVYPTAEAELTTTEVKVETVEENANMLRELVNKVIGKALDASALAKRVEELENSLQGLVEQLRQTEMALDTEREEHTTTRARLSAIEADLARKETVVHDLVMERDIALGERNTAQGERDYERSVVNGLRNDNDILNSRLQGTEHANAVLHERCERMAEHIRAFKSAYAALSEAA